MRGRPCRRRQASSPAESPFSSRSHAVNRLAAPASSPWPAVPGKRWSIACRISWSPPLQGREEPALTGSLAACLERHGLPRVPADLGLSDEQFAQAVVHAPLTRPDRYTILEHLELDDAAALERVKAFAATYG